MIAMTRQGMDLTGIRFGRLTVVEKVDRLHWRCTCDCGGTRAPQASALRSGMTQSCGCLHRERAAAGKTTHGYASGGRKRPEYKIWGAMIRRCHVGADPAFPRYGGRGITVCARWRFGEDGQGGFECFIADMGDRPEASRTIERVDNDLGYSRSNCVWASRTEQVRNRRNTVMVEWMGDRLPLAEACERQGLPYSVVKQRLHVGWPLDKALTEPKHFAEKRGPYKKRQSILGPDHALAD